MAKKSINAFNNGEVSPSTYARYDNELYDAACLKMENFIPMQTGGADRRPGTKYLSTLGSTANVIYPFVFNNSNAYTLIFSNLQLLIYKDNDLKSTLSTEYTTSELYDLKLTQSADVVFIAHPNHAVKKLSRLSDTNFEIGDLEFKYPPTIDLNPDTTFKLANASIKSFPITNVVRSSTTVTITCVGHTFAVGDMVNLINLSGSTAIKTLNGTYEVATIPSADTFTFTHDTSGTIASTAISDSSSTARLYRTFIPQGTTVEITASQDYFETTHVGAKFILKQKRDTANSILDNLSMIPIRNDEKGNVAFVKQSGNSDSLNASFSNWSIETFGTWRGKVVVQRSLDGGTTFEDYVFLGDTSGIMLDPEADTTKTIKEKNFTFASTEPEPSNSLLRVVTSFYTRNYDEDLVTQKFSFNLKTENPYIEAPCTIVSRSSATSVVATLDSPIIDSVGDYEGTNGNCKWSNGKNYLKNDKIKFDGSLEMLSGGSVQLLKTDGSTPLAGVQGSVWAETGTISNSLLVLVNESNDFKVYVYPAATISDNGTVINGSLTASSVIDLNTESTSIGSGGYSTYAPSDIAWYDNHIYTIGTRLAQNNYGGEGTLVKFNSDGSFDSNLRTISLTYRGYNQTFGLGFDGSHFYFAGSYYSQFDTADDINFNLYVTKVSADGSTIASVSKATNSDSGIASGSAASVSNWNTQFLDFTSNNGLLKVLDNDSNKIQVYQPNITVGSGLTFEYTLMNLDNEDLRGIAYNPQLDKYYTVEDDGHIQGYTTAGGQTSYYQCQVEHESSNVFEDDLVDGKWSRRYPDKIEFYESAFNKKQGFPHSIAIYESRLCFGGTDEKPNTIWLSKSNDLDNFQTGVIANDSMRLTINSNTVDEIRWLCPSTSLIIGTSANEWALGSGSDQLAVTPTQLNIKRQSNYGSNKIQGELVNASILFFMRQGTKLREWLDQNTRGVFLASDLASFADQATEGGILQMAVQTQPETIIWMIRNDGQLIGLTYEKETKTFGWHRHTFDGATAESVTVLPTSSGEDCVYVVLKKTNNERCYVKMDARNWGSTYTTEYPGLDLYKKYTNHSSATVSGLNHLEGKSVIAKVNGVTQTKTVSGNAITLDSTPSNATVYVGLSYTSTLAPLYLGLEFRSGSTRGSKIAVSQALIRFKDTLSAKVGQTETASDLNEVEFVSASSLNSEDVPCYLSNANEYLQTVYVVQDEPQPCTVLGMILDIEGVGK